MPLGTQLRRLDRRDARTSNASARSVTPYPRALIHESSQSAPYSCLSALAVSTYDTHIGAYGGRTDGRYALRGVELRYAPTVYLFQDGPQRVPDLLDALDFQGFDVPGGAKAVSDALRWEIGHGRVGRLERGRYRPLSMPRSTEHRIHSRVMDLRNEAARRASIGDGAFWNALCGT